MTTHFKGPLLGSVEAGGGLFEGMPISSLTPGYFVEAFDDFNGAVTTEAYYTETAINGGPGTAFDFVDGSFRGILRMTSTTINTGSSIQWATGADTSANFCALGAGEDFACEVGVSIDDWANCDWLIGVGLRDTTPMDSAGAILAVFGDNFAGFHHLQHATNTVPLMRAAGTAVANIQTAASTHMPSALTNATYYRFGIRISGLNRVRFYLNRQPVSDWTAMSTNFASGALMVPTVAMVANGAAIVLDWDYWHTVAERPY